MQGQERLVENACAALELAGVEGLFTRGPALPHSGIQDAVGVETVDWVDHDDVMPLCDVVVTHGGLGTTLRALAHGCPLLILPLGRDQHFNGSRVAELGAGLTMRSDAPAADIAKALTRLYADSTYRDVASELSAAIALERPDTRAAEALSGLVLR
jgi:UDP:flavonoid glycosyltransferase YjiC (YdhE family)